MAVLPDQAALYLVALANEERYQSHISFWDNIYGVNMSCVKENVFTEPSVECVDSETIISAPFALKDSCMGTMRVEDVDVLQTFQLVIRKTSTCYVRYRQEWHFV